MVNLPSKTKEMVLKALNRFMWTNNKVFKSGKQDSLDCVLSAQPETIEHLLYNCTEYSVAIWEEASPITTSMITAQLGEEI